MSLEKTLENIEEEDLKKLIENQVLEKKTLDYKLILPNNSEGEVKEFLADVCSFANSSGGDIVFGIAQDNKTGLPKEIVGIDSINVDKEILRLESMIRDGIEPRIPAVATHPIKLANSKTVFIIRIPKSWVSPHRIRFKKSYRFFARASNGKYELTIDELRSSFTITETLNEKIRSFRENRIAQLFANETPVPFNNSAKIILHLIPLSSFNPATNYDLRKIIPKDYYFEPICSHAWSQRFNLDGLLSYSSSATNLSHSFTQLYRNGIIEIVDGLLLEPSGEDKVIPIAAVEEELIKALPKYFEALKFLGVKPPVIVYLTLVGVKDYKIPRRILFHRENYSIDRDILLLPEALVESFDEKPETIFKPAFDAIWNSCGFPNSLSYNEKGEWKPKEWR